MVVASKVLKGDFADPNNLPSIHGRVLRSERSAQRIEDLVNRLIGIGADQGSFSSGEKQISDFTESERLSGTRWTPDIEDVVRDHLGCRFGLKGPQITQLRGLKY